MYVAQYGPAAVLKVFGVYWFQLFHNASKKRYNRNLFCFIWSLETQLVKKNKTKWFYIKVLKSDELFRHS